MTMYTIEGLLKLRSFATIHPHIECDLFADDCERAAASVRPAMISFRKQTNAEGRQDSVKFVRDLDVPVEHIVRASNLSRELSFAQLKTFCKKTVGVAPLDLRMMRRVTPCQARIIFHSAEEARLFIDSVPQKDVHIKGMRPWFRLENECKANKKALPAKASCVSSVEITAVESAEESEEEVVAAVVRRCDEVWANEEARANCKIAHQDSVVLPGQVSDLKSSRKIASGKSRKLQSGNRKGKGGVCGALPYPSVTAICVAHMPIDA